MTKQLEEIIDRINGEEPMWEEGQKDVDREIKLSIGWPIY